MTSRTLFLRPAALLCVGLVLMAFAPVGADNEAQAQRFKWWQDDKVRGELRLTTDQSAKIEEIFQAALPKQRTLKEKLDRLETRLSELVGGSATEAEVMKQVSEVEAIRSELGTARTLLLFRIQRVLSPDQRAKFKTLHDQERARHDQGPHGRGR